LAQIAGRQHGVVTHEQLAAVGIDKSGVTRRVPAAFEDDHERDLALRGHHITTRRYTGDQLEAASDAVATDLREALGLAS
jgi:hypothetical protein